LFITTNAASGSGGAAAAKINRSATFVVMNDPTETAEIQALVAQGYLVRTRADGDTVEARSGDTSTRDAAWASAAQYVSTDYIVADPRFTDYVVTLPGGGVARCNKVSAPAGCRSTQLTE